jgi:ATPase subunit of ABC transporter with duplicated ATPase domains
VSELLRLENFSAGYRAPVFKPLALHLAAGECVGLIGSNGAGKSTLFAALLQQARVFSGTCRLAENLAIRLQPQRPRLPHLLPVTAAELAHLAQAPPLPSALNPWRDQRLDRLSGGAFQLVSSWVTLHGPAPLALLDEPTNNLDSAALKLLSEWLRARAGCGTLVISHERAWLKRVCARCVEVRPC